MLNQNAVGGLLNLIKQEMCLGNLQSNGLNKCPLEAYLVVRRCTHIREINTNGIDICIRSNG